MRRQLAHLTARLLALSLAALACSLPARLGPNVTPGNPVGTPGAVTPTGGSPGPAAPLPAPMTAGLDGLPAYQAVLTINFDGTVLGQPAQGSQTYTLTVSAEHSGRLLSMAATGGPADTSLDGLLTGELDGVIYSRLGRTEPCSAELRPSGQSSRPVVEPVTLVPPVDLGQTAAQADTLKGVATAHYVLDENSLGLRTIQAQGDLWLAKAGGNVLKYHLQATSAQALFDPDRQGTMTWDYTLTPGEPAAGMPLPDDCPPGLGSRIPTLADATVLAQVPGYLKYTSASSVNAIADFYVSRLAALGFTPADTSQLSDLGATLVFTNAAQTLSVMIAGGTPARVSLLLENGQPETVAVAQPTTAPGVEASQRIANALPLALGGNGQPGVYPSYHLEVKDTLPVLDQKTYKVSLEQDDLTADVSGSDVHAAFTTTPQGGTPDVLEGYQIGGQAYKVVNGKAQPDSLGISVAWASWSIAVVQPIRVASVGSAPQPGETLDGRAAAVFALDTATADPATLDALKSMLPLNPLINSAKGTIWVDQQTGGLLKLVLDYAGEFRLGDGKTSLGTANGHIEITFSQIGTVAVALP